MIDRYFIPGSEWLFLKIYTGSKSADTILSEDIRILTKYLLEQTYIDSFFFIRYADPNFHIRLRLHIPKPEIGYSPIMCTIHNAFRPLMAKGLIFSVVCDTYMRELERYGEQTISSVERFSASFSISTSACSLLPNRFIMLESESSFSLFI